MKPPAATSLIVVSVAALLLAACGGGGSSAGSSSTRPKPAEESGGPAEKAVAPKAPAGSKVVSCAAGDDGAEVAGLRAVATDCGAARTAMRRWQAEPACRLGDGDSRASCSLGAYRCQAIEVDRGTAVSCARADGSDVSFIAGRP